MIGARPARAVLLLVPLTLAAASASCGSAAPKRPGQQDETLSRLGLTREVPDELKTACRRLARKTALQPVYCPPVVPASYVSVASARTDPKRSYTLDLYSDIDRKESGGHWIVAAGPPRVMGWQLSGGAKPVMRRGRVGGIAVRLYTVARGEVGGYHGGHYVVAWRWDGAEYLVSLHGYPNAARAEAIASGIIDQMKRCTSSSPPADGACRLVFGRRIS